MNEISDLAVNFENTLLASASCDKHIRIWCLKTSAPVTILMGHNATITSIKFCPLTRCISGNDTSYLVSTANDGCVCFWKYDPNTNKFSQKPFKIQEKQKPGTQIICSSFSSGGIFLAVGSSDNHVRVYHVFAPVGPTKILEIEQHSDDVDSLQFSNFSTRFISGSKDGVAHIWYYERQNWHNIPLRMTDRLPGSQGINVDDDSMRKLKVSMVAWTCDDVYVITSLSDYSLKIWDSFDGKLVHVLYGHEDEVFVIEAHPKDCRIFISGGYDGRIIIWDALTGTAIKKV